VLEIIGHVHYVGHHFFSGMHIGKRGGQEVKKEVLTSSREVKHARSLEARHGILAKGVRFHFRRKGQKGRWSMVGPACLRGRMSVYDDIQSVSYFFRKNKSPGGGL
jgi:hypothetical protein